MAVVRVRQHVNPLSSKYQVPVAVPDWSTVYARPQLPLHIDIGCGKGLFVQQTGPGTPQSSRDVLQRKYFLSRVNGQLGKG